MTVRTAFWVALGTAVVASCARREPFVRPAFANPPAAGAPRPARSAVLPLPVDEVGRLLASQRFEVVSTERAHAGVMGVAHAHIRVPARDVDLEVKWKVAPSGDADGWDNSPRKELAAYAIQQWYLDVDDWIVPPSAVRCIPIDGYRRLEPRAEPTIDGTRCVLGLVAGWLDHVKPPDVIYDRDRFLADRRYAGHLADLNVLTYLIDHRDGRSSNFLVSEDPEDGRVWSIDNGIAFGNWVWNYFVPNWDVIRVPALRRDAVERLRRVGPEQLRALLVLAELRADADGVLQPVEGSPPRDPASGTRVEPGWIQLGLTEDEVDGVAARRERLLERVDGGEIPLF